MHKVKNTAKDVMDQAEDVASFIAKIRQSERMLRDAFIEFYRGLGLLKSYRFDSYSLNVVSAW